MRRAAVTRVIRAYDDPVIRAYCWARFVILRQRFLDEIGQYLPDAGDVLDVGCGFGLFSLYYAQLAPQARFHGVDLDARRIGLAREAARRLGLDNVSYSVGDARQYRAGATAHAAAYLLDIVHHIRPEAVPILVGELWRTLAPGGCLLVKDVDTRPAYQRWFTHVLDRAVTGGPVHYWPAERLQAVLEEAGFRVYRHRLVDILPYPHVLFVCRKELPEDVDARVAPGPAPHDGGRAGPVGR